MSIPTAVFLDTSVLDGQQYNFQSTPLATFAQACAKRSMKLLLPDPTEREIKRHLPERTIEAMAALEGLRRKAPIWRTGRAWRASSGAQSLSSSTRRTLPTINGKRS